MNLDDLYGKRFFRRRNRRHDEEIKIAQIIYQIFKPEKVFDVGCALGSYLLAFKRLGCQVLGCDKYMDNAKKYCDPEILPNLYSADAGVFWEDEVEGNFNLVEYIEVAEHLPQDNALNLVCNLCRSSSKYIFFTAAHPGQRGTGHINCREKEYWIKMFKIFGFAQDTEKELEAKENLKEFGIVKNVIVFRKII